MVVPVTECSLPSSTGSPICSLSSLFQKERGSLTTLTVMQWRVGAALSHFLLLTLTPTPLCGVQTAKPLWDICFLCRFLQDRDRPLEKLWHPQSRWPRRCGGSCGFLLIPWGRGAAQRGLALQLSVWVTQFPGFHAVSSSPALNCLHSNSYPQSIHMKAFLCLEDVGWQGPKVSYGGSFSIGDRCSLTMERFRVDLWFR